MDYISVNIIKSQQRYTMVKIDQHISTSVTKYFLKYFSPYLDISKYLNPLINIKIYRLFLPPNLSTKSPKLVFKSGCFWVQSATPTLIFFKIWYSSLLWYFLFPGVHICKTGLFFLGDFPFGLIFLKWCSFPSFFRVFPDEIEGKKTYTLARQYWTTVW